MSEDPSRTHDRLYMDEDRYDRPKEMFKWISSLAQERGALEHGMYVADIGCAAGEFLYHLDKVHPGPRYYGVDVRPELVDKARRNVGNVSFRIGSVLDPELFQSNVLETVFMSGVLSIFDSFEPVLDNLLTWTKPGGRVFVFGAFNPDPIDVWVKYRPADAANRDHREAGWNIFSKRSIEDHLAASEKALNYSFYPFEIPIDLGRHPEDPVRSWTFRDEEGRRLSTNGLSLLLNLELLEIVL